MKRKKILGILCDLMGFLFHIIQNPESHYVNQISHIDYVLFNVPSLQRNNV